MKVNFELTEEEAAAANKFLEEHSKCGHGAAIGGAITWMVTPTAIGNVFKLKCGRCDVTEDVSDYSSW